MSEFDKVLNMFHTIHSAGSPYKVVLLRDRHILNPVKDLTWSAFEK